MNVAGRLVKHPKHIPTLTQGKGEGQEFNPLYFDDNNLMFTFGKNSQLFFQEGGII